MTIIRDLFPRWLAPVPPPRRRRAARPAVSPLEGRALLSGLTASSTSADAPADAPLPDSTDPEITAFDGFDDSANNAQFVDLFTIWDPPAGSSTSPTSATPAATTAAATATPADEKVTFEPRQVQKKYEDHAGAFGVTGNNNPANRKKFQDAMQALIDAPGTKKKDGVYTRPTNQDVTFYYDTTSKLMVMTTRDGKYVSGWKLSDQQLEHIEKDGKLGGGS